MNSLEILKFLSAIPSHTVGVFPADKIPRLWTKPVAFIFNTQDNSLPGQHWVAVYVSKNGHGLFFDSYGLPPYINNNIRRLRKNCERLTWNTRSLQSESSSVCGQFCIMFLDYMSRGFKMSDFVKNFTKDVKRNDKIAECYVKKLKYESKYKRKRLYRFHIHSKKYSGRGVNSCLRIQNCNCKTLSY